MTTGAAYAKKLDAIVKAMSDGADTPAEPVKAPRKKAPAKAKKPVAKTTEGKTSARKLKGLANATEAVRLKRLGYTFHQIGTKLGITRQAAQQHVAKYEAEAKELVVEDAGGLLLDKIERLDFLFQKLETGIELGDPKSISAARAILMDQAKLQGLVTDRQEVDANVTATGMFVLPMEPMSPSDWVKMATEMSAGEEETAAKLLEGSADASPD